MTIPGNKQLHWLCAYFTMFPLDFPLQILQRRAQPHHWVLDPFSGRGTTNYAARLIKLPSIGIDSSPIAHAITSAKLANASPPSVVQCATEILESHQAKDIPEGEYWSLAFDSDVLSSICAIRESLLDDCQSDARRALRGIMLGALHGPTGKKTQSYFSNQCMRSYAPKPDYSIRFWRCHNLECPPRVDVLGVIGKRAERYFAGQTRCTGYAIHHDSRTVPIAQYLGATKAQWIITSPPYYGMRTYIPDQWLRNWFVGGPASVDYSNEGQLEHGSPSSFAEQLHTVWSNMAAASTDTTQMVVRFGGVSDRSANPVSILKESFADSPWRLKTLRPAGSANSGRRQAVSFSIRKRAPMPEYDAWARLK